MKEPQQKNDSVRYLREPVLQETLYPNPLQGELKNPDKLFHFLDDVHDSTVPKMWGIFMDEDYCSIGNELLALSNPATPEEFAKLTGNIYHYYALFKAFRFTLITNHLTQNPTPTEADKQLIEALRFDSQSLSFKPNFYDYVIVSGNSYWSIAAQNGTACHCGKQHYLRPDGTD